MHTLILVAKRATARPIPFNRQDRMNRHSIRYALILVAALAVAALAVARFDGLCSILSTVWSALEPLAIGAIVGGGTDVQVEALRNYGLDTGLAFQIQDDLLNLIGKTESTKKGFRDDITEGKRTLVVVHALQNADEADRKRIIEILSSKEKDPAVLEEAVRIMQKSGSIDYARSYAENLTSIAKNRLIEMVPPSDSRDLLISMADWFVNRLK